MQNHKIFLRNLFFIALISVAIFYGWTLIFGRFFSDDFTWLWHGAKIDGDLQKILTYKMSSFYSPVLNAFYSILYRIAGYHYWVYFAAGLFVHAVVAFLSGVLMYQYTKKKNLAYLIAPLIAIAGTGYEPVVWVASNLHSIATLFILTSIIFYKQYLSTQKGIYAAGCFGGLLLALLTKEIAVITGVVLLMALTFEYLEQKRIQFSKTHLLLIFFCFFTTSIYLYYQYLWQTNGLTVNESWWSVTPISFIKIPLTFIDQIIPLSYFLSSGNAIFVSILASCFIALTWVFFRKQKAVLFGLTWGCISVLPTIFFQTEYWWNTLASRYTYLPRIGLLMACIIILDHVIKKKSFLLLVIAVILSVQGFYAGSRIYQEYPFVYNTGDSLVLAIDKAIAAGKSELLFAPSRPFENNPAHIVGAVETRSHLKEQNIIFLQKGDDIMIDDDQAYIRWDEIDNQYQVYVQ